MNTNTQPQPHPEPSCPSTLREAWAIHEVLSARCARLAFAHVAAITRDRWRDADLLACSAGRRHGTSREFHVDALVDRAGRPIAWDSVWANAVVGTLGELDDRCPQVWSEIGPGADWEADTVRLTLTALDLAPPAAPEVRHVLSLSTAHLPRDLGSVDSDHNLATCGWALADLLEYGWLLTVPDGIEDHSRTCPDTRPEVVAIWEAAQRLGCDLVKLDSDAPVHPGLPTWHW